MGLKEIAILTMLGLGAASTAQAQCPTRCEFPQLMTCTDGTKEIRPRIKRHGGVDGVDSYFIKVAEDKEEGSYEHVSYIPEAKVIAGTVLDKGFAHATIDLYLDFAPYGSIDEVYHIRKNWFSAAKFGLVDFPEMLAEGKRSGDPVAHIKRILKPYHADVDLYDVQVKYDAMKERAISAVCVTQQAKGPGK